MGDWRKAWEPVVAAVGRDFSDGAEQIGADVVERGFLRRFVEPLELSCPLHLDGDVVAPVSSIISLAIGPLWSPDGPRVFNSAERNAQPARPLGRPMYTGLEPASATASFAATADARFLRPVQVGDRLTRRGLRLVACELKETSVGRGAFVTWESEVVDEGGERVAELRTTGFRYEPRELDATSSTAAVACEVPDNQTVDWSHQRRWDDVAVGDELTPVAFPLSVYRLVVAAGANRDFNPIHHNSEIARATGAPEMYANTVFLQGMWERCVREFIGLAGTIRGWSGFRMRSFNTAGDTVVVRGRVEERWQHDGERWLALRVWSENRSGTSVGPGRVEVTLP